MLLKAPWVRIPPLPPSPNFAAEHRPLQHERLAAFREYIAEVNEGSFPARGRLVEMEAPILDEVVRFIGDNDSTTKD